VQQSLIKPAVDRLDNLFGPGGLLLVVSWHVFAIPVSVLFVGLEKVKN
jgi:hypothetical protein